MKTPYTIIKEDNRLTVLENGKIFTKGFGTHADALHSIWVMNGNKEDHFYNQKDGVVELVVTKKKLKVLELFAGSRSIGKAAEELGHEIFSVDWENYEGIDLSIDIGDLKISDIPFVPDIVFATPDCATYSMAGGSTHRLKPNYAPKTEYALKCDTVNKHWISLLDQWLLINPNMVYYIENPRAMLKKMDFMQSLPVPKVVWYCQYGDDRAKPTNIWTNNKKWIPKPECKNYKYNQETGEIIDRHCHHESARRGAKTGTQGKKGSYERSKIPHELCLEILNTGIEITK